MPSHLVPVDDPPITDQDWIDAVRGGACEGPVVVDYDLVRVELAAADARGAARE